MKKMRILFLNYEYPPIGGGAGNATEFLLREYVKMSDIEVTLVTSSPDESRRIETLGDGRIRVERLPVGKRSTDGKSLHFQSKWHILRYAWASWIFSRALLKREQYDVVHAFFSVPSGFTALLLKWEFGTPYIVSLRGADVPGYSERFSQLYFFLKPLSRLIWKNATNVVANSEGLRDLARETDPHQKIPVIRNGVDTERFCPDEARRDENIFVVTSGATRVTARKGLRYLVEAVAMLAPQYPELRLDILGDGDEKESLEALSAEQKLGTSVRFLGRIPREETYQYYQRADLFVLPSANEGMSNAMLEALASGLPIFATDTGGTKELVEDGVNGRILKMHNAKDIAEKIAWCLSHPEEVKRMGDESRRRAESLGWNGVAGEYREVYKEVTGVTQSKNYD